MKSENKLKGNYGECIAARELLKKGYNILERNYRAKTGEIDIIAKKENIIVFVEVKLRTSTENGLPGEAVNYIKQQKIIKTAKYYIAVKKLYDYSFRFDVIELLYTDRLMMRHVENAFWE